MKFIRINKILLNLKRKIRNFEIFFMSIYTNKLLHLDQLLLHFVVNETSLENSSYLVFNFYGQKENNMIT